MTDARPARPPRPFAVRHAFWLLCVAVLVAVPLVQMSPELVERGYARLWSPALCRTLGAVTGLLPFALSECLLAGLALWTLWRVGRGVAHVVRRRTPPARAALGGLWFLARIVLLVGAVFYLTWGINYARRPLPERVGWDSQRNRPADRAAQTRELGDLCARYIEATNAAYREANGSDDLGKPSAWPGTAAELDALTERALSAAGYTLGLEATFQSHGAPVKRLLLSPLMSALYLSGFFFPWTGEANINAEQPGSALPHVIAHEKCHQRGIAREDEAEFIAFVAGTLAEHPYQRYCAYSFAQAVLLRDLNALDGKRAQELRQARAPGVRRDDAAEVEFWQRKKSAVSAISITINDTYLRSHGIESGVHNYGEVTKLIVAWQRQQ